MTTTQTPPDARYSVSSILDDYHNSASPPHSTPTGLSSLASPDASPFPSHQHYQPPPSFRIDEEEGTPGYGLDAGGLEALGPPAVLRSFEDPQAGEEEVLRRRSRAEDGSEVGRGGDRLGRPENGSQGTSVTSSGSVRGDDEEEDSFHVRSTYARLELIGVPGDGWEDGVERTRERSKLNRQSVARSPTDTLDGGQLDEKERRMRGQLDRYGFFASPTNPSSSNGRLFRLPTPDQPPALPSSSASSSKPSASSSSAAQPTPPSLSRLPPPPASLSPKEAERISKWDRMMVQKAPTFKAGSGGEWTWVGGKRKKVERRVWKGVPDRWRGAAWGMLISEKREDGTDGERDGGGASKGKGKGRASDEGLLRDFKFKLDQPSPHDVQIDLDVPRTISGHVLFHTRYGLGQRSLFHSLHAFSLYCPECGYCQGMGSIAANLLCYYSAERTYVLLVRIHDSYAMHSIFGPGFPGMLENFYVQERLVELMFPDVHANLKREMISTSSFATKWYITLFCTTLPFQTQLRVWDVFFLQGRDVLIIVSLAIIASFRENLSSREASFETILSLLSSFFVPDDDDGFLRWIHATLALKGIRERMDGWRTEWRSFDAREQGKRLL